MIKLAKLKCEKVRHLASTPSEHLFRLVDAPALFD
jgi:hypothetical protein